jgi:CxxC motif-containing protein
MKSKHIVSFVFSKRISNLSQKKTKNKSSEAITYHFLMKMFNDLKQIRLRIKKKIGD